MNVLEFKKRKSGQRLSMVTCYDYWSARIISQSPIDAILVGDSAAMVMHGFSSTLSATTEMIATHVAAVARGTKEKLIIADMAFLSFRQGEFEVMKHVDLLMKAGAHGVKLEGVDGHEKAIDQIVKSGVPVMGHIGLIPQSIHALGGYKVQGTDAHAEEHFLSQGRKLEELGCFSIVLECVPQKLAATITKNLKIPTIGIGAGLEVDGQILVLQDVLGLNVGFKPKFLRTYLNGAEMMTEALKHFHTDIQNLKYPSEEESYS